MERENAGSKPSDSMAERRQRQRGKSSKTGANGSLLLLSLLGSVDGAFLLLDGVQQDAVVFGHEPFHGFFLGDTVVGSNRAFPFAALIDVVPGACQDHVKVQTVNTDAGIVFDAQIDVLLETEAKRAHVGETVFPQLVLNDLESLFEDLFGLGSSDRAMTGDLLITTDAEGTDGVTRLREHGSLT